MSTNEIKITYALRNDTAANWAASTSIPKKGEPCVEFIPDAASSGYKVKTKYGDGVHKFSELPYSGINLSEIPLAGVSVNGLLSKEDFAKIQALKALANKDTIAYADLDAALKEKLDAKADLTAVESKIGDLGKQDDGTTPHNVKTYVDQKVADVVAGSIDGLGALAAKDTVAEADLAAELATKINAKADNTTVTAIGTRMTAAEAAITTLNGTGDGSVSKQVSDAVAEIVAGAPEAYDTLKEISDWISTHASDAASMNSQITDNKTAIASLQALVGALPESAQAKTIVAYIQEVVDGSGAASADDLAAAVARIAQAETTLGNKVDKVAGKGLSTNDYTTAEKNKVAALKALANKDTIASADIEAGAVTNDKIGTVSCSKLFVAEGDTIVLDGGNAQG